MYDFQRYCYLLQKKLFPFFLLLIRQYLFQIKIQEIRRENIKTRIKIKQEEEIELKFLTHRSNGKISQHKLFIIFWSILFAYSSIIWHENWFSINFYIHSHRIKLNARSHLFNEKLFVEYLVFLRKMSAFTFFMRSNVLFRNLFVEGGFVLLKKVCCMSLVPKVKFAWL